MLKDAIFDEDQAYRYKLIRSWDVHKPHMNFVMLNPSVADDKIDDRTISRCMKFAERENCGGIIVYNLFALRSTDPKQLYRHVDPIGPQNDDYLRLLFRNPCGPVIAAWGTHGSFMSRESEVLAMARNAGCKLKCLGQTKAGHPRHPLYLKGDSPLCDIL